MYHNSDFVGLILIKEFTKIGKLIRLFLLILGLSPLTKLQAYCIRQFTILISEVTVKKKYSLGFETQNYFYFYYTKLMPY